MSLRRWSHFFVQKYGNPNSLHAFASETHQPLKTAMERIYAGIHAPREDKCIVTFMCHPRAINLGFKRVSIFQII